MKPEVGSTLCLIDSLSALELYTYKFLSLLAFGLWIRGIILIPCLSKDTAINQFNRLQAGVNTLRRKDSLFAIFRVILQANPQ